MNVIGKRHRSRLKKKNNVGVGRHAESAKSRDAVGPEDRGL